MSGLFLRVLCGIGLAFLLAWLAFAVFLSTAKSKGLVLREALRLVPDTMRLVVRLAADRTLPKAVHVRLVLLLAYLALPFDIVPDFIPVIGYADDAIILCAVLRSVVRSAGPDAIRRHWPGSGEGLGALWRVAGLPGTAEGSPVMTSEPVP